MTKHTRPLIVLGVVATAIAVAAAPVFSQLAGGTDIPTKRRGVKAGLTSTDLPHREGIEAGPMVVHAAGKVTEQFETNVYLNNTDRKADIITIFRPSVGMELPINLGDESGLSADYEVSPYCYGIWHSENHTDQRARALMELNFADYVFTVKDTYRLFTDRASNENSLRLKEDRNAFRAGVAAQFEHLGFDVGYNNNIQIYDSSDLCVGQLTYHDKDYMDQMVDMAVTYRIAPKTLLVLENDIGLIDYTNSSIPPGSFYDEATLGLRGEWSSKINVNMKAGFRCQTYDQSAYFADKAYVGAIVRGGFDYSPTEDDLITVALERAPYESIFSNMNYYTANVANVAYKHQFSDKVSGNLSGNFQYHQYPSTSTVNNQTAVRHDVYFGAGAGLRYDIRKWISVEGKYTFTERVSKFDVYDYFDNVLSISGTIGF